MIEYEKIKIEKEEMVPKSIICDVCGNRFDYKDIFEIQEFTHIRKNCGYVSVFGDGDKIECDICQNCLKEKLGKYMRVKTYED
jgi:hypothetical protein